MPPIKKIKPKVAKSNQEELEDSAVISGQLKNKIRRKQEKIGNQRGVVFIKHLPHGFFEEQLKKYFQQFGTVTRLRLVRSSRSGGSKGYAFVEFEYPEVAQVAAETMDNYLMFKKVVKATYISPNQQRFNYFKTSLRKVKNNAGKEIYISGKTAAIQRKVNEHNDWSDSAYQRRVTNNLKKIAKLKKKYAHLGIDFSSVVVEPKYLEAGDESQKTEKSTTNDDQSGNTSPTTLKKKRKIDPLTSPKAVQKSETEVDLKDLLGSTIADDSEDEDWVVNGSEDEEKEEEEDSTEDECYELAENSESEEEGSDESVDEEMQPQFKKSKSKPSYEKSIKPKNVERFDKIVKRKPYLGGIQKNVIPFKKRVAKTTSKAKRAMQVAAVKEFGKTKTYLKKQDLLKN